VTSSSSVGFGCALVLVVVIAIFIAVYKGGWDLGELEDTGWVHHDKMCTVYSRDWTNGEYKDCGNVNVETNEPRLLCDGDVEKKGMLFKVRFYGRTYQSELPSVTTLDWRCRKNGGDDPVITCERKPARE
jgi:hypothetical protein